MTIMKDPVVQDYIEPMLYSIETVVDGIVSRKNRRSVREWTISDLMMTASEAKQLAEDCVWVIDTLDIIKDFKAGAFDAEDREGGTPG